MNGRIILVIALIFGLGAAYLVSSRMGNESVVKSSDLLVIAQNVKAGGVIAAENIKVLSWPKENIPQGSFNDLSKLKGRVAKQELFSGEIILESMLAPIDSKGGLASTIPIGKRAITVRVNEVMAVAGFALPGSFVDVLASIKDPKGELITKTVLRRVKILAVAQETDPDPQKPKVVNAVTLELTAKESELLDVARNAGSLSLSLRNEYDTALESSTETSYNDLFGRSSSNLETPVSNPPRAVKKVNAIPKEVGVEIIKGNNKTEVKF